MFSYKILTAKKFRQKLFVSDLAKIHKATKMVSEASNVEETFFLLAAKALAESLERLHEESVTGEELGAYLNHNLLRYRV